MSKKTYKGTGTLSRHEEDRLAFALGIVQEKLNGSPYSTRVRRGEIERRRISILKAEKPAPGVNEESHELFRLARLYRHQDGFKTLGRYLQSHNANLEFDGLSHEELVDAVVAHANARCG